MNDTQKTPRSIAQLAVKYELGALKEIHRSNSETILLYAILIALGAIAALYTFTIGAIWIGILLAITSVLLLFGTITRNYLYLFDQGLVHIPLIGRYHVRYDQIDKIWLRVIKVVDQRLQHQSTEYLYIIQDRQGKRLLLRSPFVGQWVQTQVYQCKWPQMQAEYRAGQPLWFGPIAIQEEGLLQKSKVYSQSLLDWSELHSIQIGNGMLTIWTKGEKPKRWLQADISTIPNFPILLTLIKEHHPIQEGASSKPSVWNLLKRSLLGGLR